MDEILTFRIGIEGLENKIWREIEIPCLYYTCVV